MSKQEQSSSTSFGFCWESLSAYGFVPNVVTSILNHNHNAPVTRWLLIRRFLPARQLFQPEPPLIPNSLILNTSFFCFLVTSASTHSYTVFTMFLMSIMIVPVIGNIEANRSALSLPHNPSWPDSKFIQNPESGINSVATHAILNRLRLFATPTENKSLNYSGTSRMRIEVAAKSAALRRLSGTNV